jgi:hypothetical protein
MLVQFAIVLSSFIEGLLKFSFAGRYDFLRGGRLIISRKSVMGKLKDPSLSDNAVNCVTVKASLRFSTLLVYPLADLSSLEVINVRSPQLLQKGPPFGFRE